MAEFPHSPIVSMGSIVTWNPALLNQPKKPQSYTKHAEAAVQVPDNLPLVPKPFQSCTTHAAAAVQEPGDVPLVPKQPQSFSKHAKAAV